LKIAPKGDSNLFNDMKKFKISYKHSRFIFSVLLQYQYRTIHHHYCDWHIKSMHFDNKQSWYSLHVEQKALEYFEIEHQFRDFSQYKYKKTEKSLA
jgi:hypothetical protein